MQVLAVNHRASLGRSALETNHGTVHAPPLLCTDRCLPSAQPHFAVCGGSNPFGYPLVEREREVVVDQVNSSGVQAVVEAALDRLRDAIGAAVADANRTLEGQWLDPDPLLTLENASFAVRLYDEVEGQTVDTGMRIGFDVEGGVSLIQES